MRLGFFVGFVGTALGEVFIVCKDENLTTLEYLMGI